MCAEHTLEVNAASHNAEGGRWLRNWLLRLQIDKAMWHLPSAQRVGVHCPRSSQSHLIDNLLVCSIDVQSSVEVGMCA